MSHTDNPKPVVGILIYNDAGEVLLWKSRKWTDKWVVFWGHVEWGESLLDAVKRETREETGLEIQDIEFIGLQESIFSEEFHKPKHMIFLNYAAKAITNEVILNDEMQEYAWIKPEKSLSELNLNASSRIFIQSFIDKK